MQVAITHIIFNSIINTGTMTLNTGNGHTVLSQQDLCQQFPPTFYDFPYISVTDVKFRHIFRFSRFSRQVVNLITKDKPAEQNKTVAPYYYCCWFLFTSLSFQSYSTLCCYSSPVIQLFKGLFNSTIQQVWWLHSILFPFLLIASITYYVI